MGVVQSKQNQAYLDDTEELFERIYVTPAKPINRLRFATELNNSRIDEYVQSNKLSKADDNSNTPTGRYGAEADSTRSKVLLLLLTFDGTEPDMPPYIRLGKKRCKALIGWEEVCTTISSGTYKTTHPLLIEDVDSYPLGDISFKRMQPFDVIQRASFSGDYIKLSGEDVLPLNVRFLRRMRS